MLSGGRRLPAGALLATAGAFLGLVAWGLGSAALARHQPSLLLQLGGARLLAGVLVGAALAVAGALLQGVLRNDLVEPGVLGLQAGGVLTATLLTLLFPSAGLRSPLLVAGGAWAGALLACAAVYLLARGPGGYEPTQLLLTGVGVGGACAAVTIVVVALASPSPFAQGAVARQLGSLAAIEPGHLALLGPLVVALGGAGFLLTRPLDTLALGEDAARGLGLELGRTRLWALAVAAGLSGACVAVGGGLSFVGLLAPHAARRLVGPGLRRALPLGAWLGALLVLAADRMGRSLLAGAELPAGLFVAVLGAPYFLYLLMRS